MGVTAIAQRRRNVMATVRDLTPTTTRELARRFAVSPGAILRDLRAIVQDGIPLERAPHWLSRHGYAWEYRIVKPDRPADGRRWRLWPRAPMRAQ